MIIWCPFPVVCVPGVCVLTDTYKKGPKLKTPDLLKRSLSSPFNHVISWWFGTQ